MNSAVTSVSFSLVTVFGHPFDRSRRRTQVYRHPWQRLNASETIRTCEMNGMKPSKEDNVSRAEKHDRPDDEEPQLVPPDLGIDEGDEAKKEATELPPAMPPKV